MVRTVSLAIVLAVGISWAVRAETPPDETAPVARVVRLGPSVQILRTPDLSTLSGGGRSFQVVCRLESTQTDVPNPVRCTLPPVTVRDGERVSLSDSVSQRFVLAEKAEAGATTPIARDVATGMSFVITVIDAGNDEVVVDVQSDAQTTRQRPVEKARLIRVDCVRGRLIGRAKLGETLRVDFEDQEWFLEATVTAAP